MPKKSSIVYHPSWTLQENADKNGVSVEAIRYYLKTRGIDREGDRQAIVIAKIKAAKEKLRADGNTNPTRAQIAEQAKIGINTLRKYLPVVEGKGEVESKRQRRTAKSLVWDVDIPEPKKQNYALMSSRLATLPELFRDADAQDVSGLREFLFASPEKPMLFIGNGGMLDHFAGHLYEMNGGIARCITPLELASMSDAAIRSCCCLLLSVGGGNMDIKYAAKRLLSVNPENTACYTNHLHEKSAFKDFDPSRVFLFHTPRYDEGFISVENKFYRDAVMYRAFTGERASEIEIDTSFGSYEYRLNDSAGQLTPLKRIRHFVVLFSDYSGPAAHDFESVVVETGVASAQVSDYRNYCHGRFLFVGNHTRHETKKHTLKESDVAVVLFVSPRNRELVQQIREKALAKETPIVLIETKYNDSRAVLDLLIKSNVFLAHFEEKGLGINPCDPENYNTDGIDKRIPKSGVKFVQEMNRNGELRYKEASEPIEEQALSAESIALKQELDALAEIEHQNTEKLKKEPLYYPCPEKKDIKRQETYDASTHLCIAFRSKDDLWKDMWVPLGNMNGGFPFEMNGITFPTSEHAYIIGGFSENDEDHIRVQGILLEDDNGYGAKKRTRERYREFWRRDWNEFNVDWMLYAVWNKVQKNEPFRNLLMSLPQGAIIIEDVSFKGVSTPDTAAFWGSRNAAKKAFGKVARDYAKSLNLEKDIETERVENALLFDYCNIGEYVGVNAMGKILTIIKKCLHDGTEPPIDYDLLNRKNIYLFGKKVELGKDTDCSTNTAKDSPCQYPLDGEKVYGILGGIIGDIVGSTREGYSHNVKSPSFELFDSKSKFTDDTAMSVALADWILHPDTLSAKEAMMRWGRKLKNRGYGGLFKTFLETGEAQESSGNGAAMRVYPIAAAAKSLKKAVSLAEETALVSHNTDVAVIGAKAMAASIFLVKDGSRRGKKEDVIKSEIKSYVEENYGYDLSRSVQEIRAKSLYYGNEKALFKKTGKVSADYIHMSNAALSVPMAIIAFLNGKSYEETLRIAAMMGGDSDTICCMAGCLAAQLYGIPKEIADTAFAMLTDEMKEVVEAFNKFEFGKN